MEKHKCIDCIHHETDSMETEEGDFLGCYCKLGHDAHDKSGCDPYNIENGKPIGGLLVECDDFEKDIYTSL